MAEFFKVMKEVWRMCNAYENCIEGCPLYEEAFGNCCLKDCSDVLPDYGVMEGIVLEWAAENPEPKYPTWIEWQKSTFPEAQKTLYPCNFTTLKSDKCYQIGCHECLNQSIPADIAKKLGIKPIEGGT